MLEGADVGTTDGTLVGRALKVGFTDGTDVGEDVDGANDGADGDDVGPVGARVYTTVGFLVGREVG